MHARMIRRNLSPRWPRISLLTFMVLAVKVTLLILSGNAHADINVSVINVELEDSYASQRIYAGRTIASRAAQLGFKRGGEVATVSVDIGDAVAAGAILASLNTQAIKSRMRQASAEVSLAKANLMANEADMQLAANTERRFRTLREQGHASKQIYDETRLSLRAKQAQLNVGRANLERATAAREAVEVDLDEAIITAPFAGVIQSRLVDEGSQINSGEPALRLVEQTNSEAHVGIPAELGTRFTPGNTYSVRWNNQNYAAKLRAVLPEIDPVTRTLTAVFGLLDSNIPLGSVVELTFDEKITASGYWLPLSSLTEADRGLWGVYVINSEQAVERRVVEIVHTEAERVFVRGTLSNQDRVVATGVQRIVPGQIVSPTPTQQVGHAR